MFIRILCALAVSMALILSCSDEITNNYYQNTNGAVFGNVVPADSGVVELDGLSDITAPIDAAGFFNIANVAPGKYTLTVRPQNHSKRLFEDVVVGTGVTTQFTNVTIANYPYPIYSVNPPDGSVNVSTYLYMSIVSDEELGIEALNASTSFEPDVFGTWDPYQDDEYGKATGQFRYTFYPYEVLKAATQYTMTIDAESLATHGTALAEDLVTSFTTRQMTVTLYVAKNSYTSRVSRRDFSASLRTQTCMATDSVAKSVRFEPEIEGQWFQGDLYPNCGQVGYAREHRFLLVGQALLRKTTYKAFIDGAPLGTGFKDTIEFVTEGYEVTDVRPRNGYDYVPADNQVLVIFNEPMDTVSVRLAFSVTKVGGDEVPGTFAWDEDRNELMWSHWDNLYAEGTYIIEVTTDAKIESGANLDVGWKSYFKVE